MSAAPRMFGSKRSPFIGDSLYDTVLTQANTGLNERCRVCQRALSVGDHVTARRHHAGYSCVTPCGWFTLDDLKWESSWRKLLRGDVPTESERTWLRAMRLVTLDERRHILRLTDAGRRLRDQAAASQALREPSSAPSADHAPPLSPAGSRGASGAGGGR
jgi:hypothetical protein